MVKKITYGKTQWRYTTKISNKYLNKEKTSQTQKENQKQEHNKKQIHPKQNTGGYCESNFTSVITAFSQKISHNQKGRINK
jgi:hypothetical protein